MSKAIQKDSDKIIKILNQYVKHKNLEIELTLKNGKKVVLERDRDFIANKLVYDLQSGKPKEIPVQEIKKADIYAL